MAALILIATGAESTVLADTTFAAFVLDFDFRLANRFRHRLGALVSGLAKTDFLDNAGFLGDDSLFVMLFSFDGTIDKGTLGCAPGTIDRPAGDFDILVAQQKVFR